MHLQRVTRRELLLRAGQVHFQPLGQKLLDVKRKRLHAVPAGRVEAKRELPQHGRRIGRQGLTQREVIELLTRSLTTASTDSRPPSSELRRPSDRSFGLALINGESTPPSRIQFMPAGTSHADLATGTIEAMNDVAKSYGTPFQ